MVLGEISVNQCKSNVYLLLFTITACFQLLLASAVIYGYSSLLVIFKDLRLYRNECKGNLSNILAGNSSSSSLLGGYSGAMLSNITCPVRDQALNLPFAFGMIMMSIVKIPLGNLVDTIGAKSSQYIGWYYFYIFIYFLFFLYNLVRLKCGIPH